MLSFRLSLALSYLSDPSSVILDVGADHGLFSLAALKRCRKVYASENKKGPYQNLVSSIKGSEAVPLFMDGLAELPEDVDTLVILGMGGRTIQQILSEYPKKTSSLKRILIEPQSEFSLPISYLASLSFENVKGEYFIEKKVYPMLLFVKGKEKKLTPLELEYGSYPLSSHDEVLYKYLKERYTVLQSHPMTERSKKELLLLSEVLKDETK